MSEDRPVRGRLDSWKEIAAYLNRDVRTVIRWEAKGLPVHRVPGGKRQAVFAYPAEIDAWMSGDGHYFNGDHASLLEAKEAGAAAQTTASGHNGASGLNLPSRQTTAPDYSAASAHRTSFGGGDLDRHRAGDKRASGDQASRQGQAWPALSGKFLIAAGFLVALLGIAAISSRSRTAAAVRPLSVNQLTHDGRSKGNLHTDGTTLYFNEAEGARAILASAPLSGSPIRQIDTPFSNVALQDVSKDGKTLLLLSYEGILIEGPLWTMPAQGGTPRRVGDAVCDMARWDPADRRIACADRTSITVMDADGSNPRTVASFASPVGPIVWTPDGQHLRYVLSDITAHTTSAWEIEVATDGTASQPQRLTQGAGCCFDWTWTRDGQAFASTYVDASGKSRLMLQPSGSASATELAVNIGDVTWMAPGESGNALYLAISDAYRGELLKFDTKQKALQTYLPGISATYLAFSPDGQWITYADTQDYSLWRSRADGSEALELVKPPMQAQVASWSPDGREIAFMGQAPGRPWRIYLIGRDGGPLREAAEGDDNQGGPSWSPDGKSMVYGNVFCEKTQTCWIRRLNLATRKTQIVPGSNGLRTARWSPDGKYIAALRFQARELMLFDIGKQRWRMLADSVGGDNINWSSDSQYVFVDNPRDTKPVVDRVRIKDGQRVTVISLSSLQNVPGTINTWFGLTPDNSPILSHMFNADEIYKLDWTEQ